MDLHLKAILEGDRRGLEKIYEEYQPRIVRHVVDNSGTVEEGQDLFQEAIIVIFKQVRGGDFKLSSSFYTYLFAICKRLWLKKLRKKRNSVVTFSEDWEYTDDTELEAIIQEEERYRLFRAKFRLLSDQCRKLLSLFFQKVPMKEIVSRLQMSSISYAKKRKFQCKEKLIALIRDDQQYQSLK